MPHLEGWDAPDTEPTGELVNKRISKWNCQPVSLRREGYEIKSTTFQVVFQCFSLPFWLMRQYQEWKTRFKFTLLTHHALHVMIAATPLKCRATHTIDAKERSKDTKNYRRNSGGTLQQKKTKNALKT